jgi:hypothetical protein
MGYPEVLKNGNTRGRQPTLGGSVGKRDLPWHCVISLEAGAPDQNFLWQTAARKWPWRDPGVERASVRLEQSACLSCVLKAADMASAWSIPMCTVPQSTRAPVHPAQRCVHRFSQDTLTISQAGTGARCSDGETEVQKGTVTWFSGHCQVIRPGNLFVASHWFSSDESRNGHREGHSLW